MSDPACRWFVLREPSVKSSSSEDRPPRKGKPSRNQNRNQRPHSELALRSGYVKFVPDSTSLTEVLHKPRTSVQMQGLERTAAHAGLHTWVGCTVGGDRELLGALCLWTSAVD